MPKSTDMPTAYILRFSFCSILLFTLVFDSMAQRRASRRSVTVTQSSEFVVEGNLVKKIKDTPISDSLTGDIDLKKNYSSAEPTTETPVCRETKGINKIKIADSYPYITDDGLRLYFTSNREGGHGRFFISSRKSITDPFGEPKVLSPDLTDGFYAGTLTADELTLCMVNSGAMYISIRSDKSAAFPDPVKLAGATDNYHFGPSISADGKEIFVTVTTEGKDRTRIYKRTGTYQVEKIKELSVPEGSEAGPGQLSKDGLSYYLSIETKSGEYLWHYSRKTTADDFGNPAELPQQLKGLANIIQPSLNRDGSVIVFVTSPGNTWEEDDILLVNTAKKSELPKIPTNILTDAGNTVKLVQKMNAPQLLDYSTALKENLDTKLSPYQTNNAARARKLTESPSILQLRVYPNPFTTVISIEINALPADGALLYVYDESGKLIKQQKVNNTRTVIPFNRSLPGAYTYRVTDSKGNLIGSGKLIKVQ